MKKSSFIVGLVVAILWYFSAFYIAAPHDVHNMLFGGFGMTHQQHQMLGLMLFLVSLLVITLWAVSTESEEKLPLQTSQPTSTAPASA